jgi:hypothetical protein
MQIHLANVFLQKLLLRNSDHMCAYVNDRGGWLVACCYSHLIFDCAMCYPYLRCLERGQQAINLRCKYFFLVYFCVPAIFLMDRKCFFLLQL